MVREPEILILDDASSALDYATDAALRRAVRQASRAMTVFTVSQRVSAVRQADCILVMDDGRLVLSGTPREVFSKRDFLDSIGLDVPLPAAVGSLLAAKGCQLPETVLDEDELVEALCRLKSKI